MITFYSIQGCPYCQKAIILLKDEINNNKVIVKSHTKAPSYIKNFPYLFFLANHMESQLLLIPSLKR